MSDRQNLIWKYRPDVVDSTPFPVKHTIDLSSPVPFRLNDYFEKVEKSATNEKTKYSFFNIIRFNQLNVIV